MTDVSNRNRTPAGVPTGGEFAQNSRDDANGALGFPPVTVTDLRPGDTVDMNDVVSDYVDRSFDAVLDDEDNGEWMKGNHVVREVREGAGGTTRVILDDYEWTFNPNDTVSVVGRAPEAQSGSDSSSFAGLASYQTAATIKTEQPKIGYSPDPSLVDVVAPSTGSGMTFEIGVKDGGALTLHPKDLGSLDASNSFDRVTVRNVGGTLVAEGEIGAGNVADTKDAAFMDANRAKVDAYLANFDMRLPAHVPDWTQVTIIRDLDLSGHQSTLQGPDGQYRPQVYTDNINEEVTKDRAHHYAYNEWIREGRMAQGIRQHVGLALR